MPSIGQLANLTFAVVTTVVAYCATLLRRRLKNRQPCERWFAFLMGMLSAALVFCIWSGVYGLGAAQPGWGGFAFGLFAGSIWGGVFSFINSWILWRAFDSPNRDYEQEHEQMMNTDLGVLFSQLMDRVRSFQPNPQFTRSGGLPWAIFLAAIILPLVWSLAFCQLVWLTEGAPGVDPAIPIQQ